MFFFYNLFIAVNIWSPTISRFTDVNFLTCISELNLVAFRGIQPFQLQYLDSGC